MGGRGWLLPHRPWQGRVRHRVHGPTLRGHAEGGAGGDRCVMAKAQIAHGVYWASIGLTHTVERAVPGTREVLLHAEALASSLQWSVRRSWLCLIGEARHPFFNSTAAFARCKAAGVDCLPMYQFGIDCTS